DLVIHMPLIAKIISVIFTILCILIIRLYVNRMKQRDLYKKVNLEQLDKSYVKVKPQNDINLFVLFIFCIFILRYIFFIRKYFCFIDGKYHVICIIIGCKYFS